MTMTYHKEHVADQAAMQAMRAELRAQPAIDFRPEARPIFDKLMAKTPAAQNVIYDAATIGGIAGWWFKPLDAAEGTRTSFSMNPECLCLHAGSSLLARSP
jgi:epsilon-lactone hydrolase